MKALELGERYRDLYTNTCSPSVLFIRELELKRKISSVIFSISLRVQFLSVALFGHVTRSELIPTFNESTLCCHRFIYKSTETKNFRIFDFAKFSRQVTRSIRVSRSSLIES